MNEFELHEQLLAIESIADQYKEGKKYVPEVRKTRAQLSSRQYRVAVIGEFKRGKSSLINAIIGAEVLPTDILPMTATITRVTYGNTRSIVIRYKDGHTEEKTIEELLDYATKYDEKKAQTASSIQEIIVHYPSVFCKNHIDILDTPGLNDNEPMTEVTLSILGKVDAAIVVISANHPMSLTEKKLILELIEQKGIRHLVFVVTHIDLVSRRKTEQDRIIQFIKDRISNDILQMAVEKYEGDPPLKKKAEQILQKPDIFGVSSVQAIEGFIQDDWDLLEESRFPYFKKELLALLTSAQSLDMDEKVALLAGTVCRSIAAWHHSDIAELEKRQREIKEKINQLNRYYADAHDLMNRRFIAIDTELSNVDCDPDTASKKLVPELKSFFVARLSEIRESNNSDQTVQRALDQAYEESEQYMQSYQQNQVAFLHKLLLEETMKYGECRLALGFSGKAFAEDLKEWFAKQPPMFAWTTSPIPEKQNLQGVDVILHVNYAIEKTVSAFVDGLNAYISEWRVSLIHRNGSDIKDREPMERLFRELQSLESEIAYRKRDHQNNMDKLNSICPKDISLEA